MSDNAQTSNSNPNESANSPRASSQGSGSSALAGPDLPLRTKNSANTPSKYESQTLYTPSHPASEFEETPSSLDLGSSISPVARTQRSVAPGSSNGQLYTPSLPPFRPAESSGALEDEEMTNSSPPLPPRQLFTSRVLAYSSPGPSHALGAAIGLSSPVSGGANVPESSPGRGYNPMSSSPPPFNLSSGGIFSDGESPTTPTPTRKRGYAMSEGSDLPAKNKKAKKE